MGLIAKIKELFSAQTYIFKAMAEMDRQNTAYAAMTHDELLGLSDDELISAALYRTDKKLADLLGKKKKGTPAQWAEQLTEAQRVAFILSYFESDVQTGGLEYFIKRNNDLTPSVSSCLEAVGATEHQKLYDNWLADHGSDLNHSELLELQDALTSFDQNYRALPAMEELLAPYLRKHINEF